MTSQVSMLHGAWTELSQNDEYRSCSDNEEVGASNNDNDNEDVEVYPTLLLGQTSRFGRAIRINRRFLRWYLEIFLWSPMSFPNVVLDLWVSWLNYGRLKKCHLNSKQYCHHFAPNEWRVIACQFHFKCHRSVNPCVQETWLSDKL